MSQAARWRATIMTVTSVASVLGIDSEVTTTGAILATYASAEA
jgi:hypothetical protein